MKRVGHSLVTLTAAAALSACGSSGGAGASGQPLPPAGTDAAQVFFSVTIPAPSPTGDARGRVRPDYVSLNTQSMSVSVNGGLPQVFALTPSTNSNCSVSSGATVCSNLEVSAAPGVDSFTFALYSNAVPLPSSPTVLSIVTVANKQIAEGVANQLGVFTLNPVLGSVALSVSIPAGGFTAGSAASGLALNVATKDPSGATIIAPGEYVNASGAATPIGLSTNWTTSPNDAVWSFSVDGGSYAQTGSLASPADHAELAYSGASIAGTTTITAAAGSISASQEISAIVAPIVAKLSSSVSAADYLVTTEPPELDFYESGISGTVSLSELGYSGSFTLTSTTCSSADVTFSPAAGQSGTSFAVDAISAGTTASPAVCTATFADTNSQTLSVTFSVTTISFGLQ